MSVELIGGETPLGQIASNYGWQQTLEYMTMLETNTFPELRRLMQEGISENPELLKSELQDFLSEVQDENVRDVLQNMSELLTKTKEPFVIVS